MINSLKKNVSEIVALLRNKPHIPKRYIIVTLVGLLAVFLIGIMAIINIKPSRFSQKKDKLISQQKSPTPSVIDTTGNRTVEYTGADSLANKEYLENHPELLIEAKLKSQLPLEFPDFTVDYSYTEDKFIVKLTSPVDRSRKNFFDWMKKAGLVDEDRFILTSK